VILFIGAAMRNTCLFWKKSEPVPKLVIRGRVYYPGALLRGGLLDLFNNPVGCFTRLADVVDFLQKSATSAVFLAEVVQYLKLLNNAIL
jgi:hypothetical protein